MTLNGERNSPKKIQAKKATGKGSIKKKIVKKVEEKCLKL